MAKTDYRRSDTARLIMSRVHARPRAQKCPRFNVEAVKTVLDAFGHKSVWSGGGDDLTIVRIDKSRPLSVGNAMVLQVRETNRSVPASVVDKAKEIVGQG